ncbi:MAG: Uncharacterized protein G01um101470_192 [Parcubacteria group bacterium Gr01-1014_70]|nr:MAG: Uncharacterized protein G01um101470_192 [Parcubacteria group bacterium Gr01-1014_70]
MQRERKLARGQSLFVGIRSRDVLYYEGKATAVSSRNAKGPFDILPQHTHFISLITDGVVIHMTDGTDKKIDFLNAVLKVKDNKVEIYIGIDQSKR